MRKHPQIVIGVLLIALFICIAITAPLLAPNDPNATNLALKNAPPSAEYPLGCDQMGRCELSRLIYGARYSLSLTVPVLIVLAAIALFIGCYTSYKGGLIDEVIRLLCDIFMAFPLLVIAMSLVSVINNSVASIITAIGISMSAWFLRMARSYAKTECGKGYICDQLGKIGIELTPQSAQMMDWYAMITTGEYGLTLFKTQGGFYDPGNTIGNIDPSMAMDPIISQVAAYLPGGADLITELESTTDEERIQEIYGIILTTMADQCLTTPLVYPHQLAVYSDKIANYDFPPDANFTAVQNITLK